MMVESPVHDCHKLTRHAGTFTGVVIQTGERMFMKNRNAHRMIPINRMVKALFGLAVICLVAQMAGGFFRLPDHFHAGPATVSAAGQPDIHWFKEQMKISDKYVEQQEGILGMSWTHFFTMVILILFAAGALIMMFFRYRRIQQILDEIRKEK